MNLRLFSADDVHRALPMSQAIEGVKAGYVQLSAGRVQAPLRTPLAVSPNDVTLIMPFFAPPAAGADGALGLKLVSVFNSNVPRGLPLIHSIVMAVDPSSGAPLALIEGSSLTAIRTGAASGAATDVLARPGAAVAAIFGSGVQARRQLEAVCTVRPIERVFVYSLAGAEVFAVEMAGMGPIPTDIRIAATPREALAEADVVCTATTALYAGLRRSRLAPRNPRQRYRLFHPGDAGDRSRDRAPVAGLCRLDRGRAGRGGRSAHSPQRRGDHPRPHQYRTGRSHRRSKPGRTSTEQITFFKSVGVAVQDAVAASIILHNGPMLGLGTTIEL